MAYYQKPEEPKNYGNNISQQKPDSHRGEEILLVIIPLVLGIPINILSAWIQQNILQNTFSPLVVTATIIIIILLLLILLHKSHRRFWFIITIGYIVTSIITSILFPSVWLPSESNPYSPHMGKMILNDSLKDNSNERWDIVGKPSDRFSCLFVDGAYHVTAQDGGYKPCHATLNASNFTFEVQMTIISGNCGGMAFHDIVTQQRAYFFAVCKDGTFRFDRFDSTTRTTLYSGTIGGLQDTNTIAIVANGSNYDLYINSHKVASVNDPTYNQGSLGVSADGPNCEVAYTNARIWVDG